MLRRIWKTPADLMDTIAYLTFTRFLAYETDRETFIDIADKKGTLVGTFRQGAQKPQ
jgi:hypothetical protein